MFQLTDTMYNRISVCLFLGGGGCWIIKATNQNHLDSALRLLLISDHTDQSFVRLNCPLKRNTSNMNIFKSFTCMGSISKTIQLIYRNWKWILHFNRKQVAPGLIFKNDTCWQKVSNPSSYNPHDRTASVALIHTYYICQAQLESPGLAYYNFFLTPENSKWANVRPQVSNADPLHVDLNVM